ncbi:TPA: hypothetical protein N0F65_005140 [Lagenidium giganteum]|uniref:Uncharacterized protein n=1 Tax=Lagenidium giganteum TaxID=4803 RepID=A0AAV2YTH5_9STRA|nr:TPA: hypothetical protein N0F65_005140 [Lagenidium giganteum]
MFASFARRVGDTSDLKLSKLRLLLRQHELEVDDTLYRQWEQTLPEGAHTITFPQFVHACHQLYGQKALVAHFNTRVWDGNTLVKSQSAPQLHPFDLLEQKNEDALAFNYEDYLQRPMPAKKTDDERLRHKQSRLIQATQELRRKTKLLHGLNLAMPGSKDSDSSSVSPQHERLHQEKLAHHILKRGSILALAPANRAKVVSSSLLQREKVMKQKTKDVRQHHIETAKAFASSVAMISRHVQHEEFKDLCDSQLEEQFARVDEQKRLNRVHKAHCHALAADKQQQQLREVQAMKTIAKEELQMVKKYVQLRQEMAKLTHGKPFTLSPSSSTLFQQPPELMAARATAKGGSQKKKLRELEKEYLEHARSIQLLDYVYDRRRAAMMSTKPKAEAALVDVELTDLPDDRAEKLATQELWEQLLEELKVDMSQFIPSANSPPAALKYYGTSRPVILPPFSSSVERKTM